MLDTMSPNWLRLQDPITQKPLQFFASESRQGFGYMESAEGEHRWPVAMGIPFLRVDRVSLAELAVADILSENCAEALARLLQDTDDFAPTIPSLSHCRQIATRLLADDDELVAWEIMTAVEFGPVSDYFALRGLAPTFLSGCGLLKLGVNKELPLIEVGCGVGHFLYWLAQRGIEAVGTDSVFSKLVLAHRFMNIGANHLICSVAGRDEGLPMATTQPVNVFCHDAFYFIKEKARCLAEFRRLAGPSGSVLVGHAHLSTADHGKVSGFPCALDTYRGLADSEAHFFDDAALVDYGIRGRALQSDIPQSAEAISFIEGAARWHEPTWWDTEELLHAPIHLTWDRSKGCTQMNWPSEAFAKEYSSADYLHSTRNPFEFLPCEASTDSLNLHPGLAIPTPYLAMGVKPIRWGIIGGGWIASDYFIPAFGFTPLAKLIAVAESNEDRRTVVDATFKVTTFSDWREMIAVCRLDAVYIATPNHLHAEIFCGAAAAGLRVLCEKPLATNSTDLEKILKGSEQSPTAFQTAYDQRYHPAHLHLAQRISEGDIGKVTQIRIHYACWVDDIWSKVASTENWRIDSNRAGGGAGFDLLPHCLDLISVLVNDTIIDAHLLYQNHTHDFARASGIDDGALLAIRTKGGILASIHVGYNCPENQPRRRIEILGTLGRVEALNTMGQDPGGELIWQLPGGEKREVFSTLTEAGPFARQLDAVSRLWIRDDTPAFPFESDLSLAELLIDVDRQAKRSISFLKP